MKLHQRCFLIMVIFCSSSLYSQTQFHERIHFERLSDKTLIVQAGEVYPDQVVAVASERGIVLFDSGISPTLSKAYRKIIEREFGRNDFVYVINTHHHFDHTNGNQVFADACIVAHENCPEGMKTFTENMGDFITYRRARYSRRDSLAKTLSDASKMKKRLQDLVFTSRMMCDDLESSFKSTLPTLTFNDRVIIDLGDLTLKLIYFGPGYHTDNDVIATIPEEGLVFTGDLLQAYETVAGVTSDGHFSEWLSALDAVLKDGFDIKHIVTIHAGILEPERLMSFHKTLQKMVEEKCTKKSAIDELKAFISEFGVRDGIERLNALRVNSMNDYYLWEGDFIAYAADFMKKDKREDAVALFEFIVSLFPHSVAAHEWLGDAYILAGQYPLAIKTFTKTLELYPLDSYAKDMIYKMQKEKSIR